MNIISGCTAPNKMPKALRKAKIIALPKPEKDPSIPESYRPISLLCHTFNLSERFILVRVAQVACRNLVKPGATA